MPVEEQTIQIQVFNIYSFQGCYQAVLNWAMSHLDIIIGVGIGLALLELLGIFLAFCLTKNINSYIKWKQNSIHLHPQLQIAVDWVVKFCITWSSLCCCQCELVYVLFYDKLHVVVCSRCHPLSELLLVTPDDRMINE